MMKELYLLMLCNTTEYIPCYEDIENVAHACMHVLILIRLFE